MLALIVPVVLPVINLAGMIKYLAMPEVTDKWIPLSGGWLNVFDNPVLFGMFGFKYGQKSENDVLFFAVPTFNKTVNSAVSIYPRPWNSKNSNGRNTGKNVLDVVQSTLKAHNHPGSTSSDGSHSHSPAAGSRLSEPAGPYPSGGGQYPLSYGVTTSSAGHDNHSHSGGAAGPMSMDAQHTSTEVEPKGYGALLCIHKG